MTPATDSEDGPTRPKGIDEIREAYAEDSTRKLDWADRLNRLLTGRYRARLFGEAEGRVLDVACGMGTNLRYLPASVEYVGVDVSPEMLRYARRAYADREPEPTFREMDAQALAFDDDSFDTVISSLSTCTFPDPVAALEEMGRVCAPDGWIRLLEHGRSDVGPIARLQDWRADAHYEKHACRLNQEPLEVLARSSLSVREAETAVFGALTAVSARPA